MSRVVNQSVFLEEADPWPVKSWVVSVKHYVYGSDHYAIAELLQDKEGRTKKYVYCGISTDDWSDFTWSIVDQELNFGQKFRKYIMPYRCNCQ